ncbi:MAG TPA: endolytic transglycosylase MltG [Bacteroidia bacterium]|nr:endolytic transglycosylase MltG [Bacteroidia bacterium]
MAKKKKSFRKKILISLFLIVSVTVIIGGYIGYKAVYQSNVSLNGKKSQFIYIHTGATFEEVLNMLYEKNIIINRTTFEWLAKQKKYPENIKPGRYRVLESMSNDALINLLRSGKQEPIEFTLNDVRTKEQLASRVSGKIEADSVSIMNALNDNDFLQKYGMNKNNIMALFIPETYQFYWNTSVDEWMDKMASAYKKMWTVTRKNEAQKMEFTQTQVSILASIVQAEQSQNNEEKRIIAGLYINRLKRGMPLQSDPTLIYAAGDFSITRVLNADKTIDSPYNTYMYKGLPPGPILLPEISSIDAVLNYDKNNYIYMCAEFGTGKHDFSTTIAQQSANARKFRKCLNENNILR